jgi:hypothetical protein
LRTKRPASRPSRGRRTPFRYPWWNGDRRPTAQRTGGIYGTTHRTGTAGIHKIFRTSTTDSTTAKLAATGKLSPVAAI